MNKIAITTGYMGSGSSAMTDLLSEFKRFSINRGDFEYILLHCPDGLFDLEDKLLCGNNALRSDEAIHRFIKCMNTLYNTRNFWPGMYSKRISPQFNQITKKFVQDLVDFEFKDDVYWYFQQIPDKFEMQLREYANRLLVFLSGKRYSAKASLKYKGMKISYPTQDEFYKKSKVFLTSFYALLGYDEHDLLLDQFLLPHNLFRLNNYFDDNVRVIVIDRDPRDVFVLNKYVWLKKGCPVAYPIDAVQFCDYYKKMRNAEKLIDDDRILRIHFEDLVYRYDESVRKVCEFMELSEDEHIYKKQKFNPNISIHNTQVFENDCVNRRDIQRIEENLNMYIYKFPYAVESNSRSCF